VYSGRSGLGGYEVVRLPPYDMIKESAPQVRQINSTHLAGLFLCPLGTTRNTISLGGRRDANAGKRIS
jgi:hypothetical protein